MNHSFRRTLSLTALAAAALTLAAPALAADDVAVRVKALDSLLAEQWEYNLKDSPEFATIIGDYRYNDKVSDVSLAHVQQQKKDAQDFLARFQAIDTSGFPEQELLSQKLMVEQLQDTLKGFELKTYEQPLDQFNGIHLQLAQLVSALPFDSTKHYEDYLARLHQVPKIIDQVIEVARQGQKDGLMQPKFLLEKVSTQAKSIAEPAGEASAFGQPVAKFPDTVPEADRKRLHDAILQAVDTEVRPAYQKLAAFVATEYAPKGRAQPGLWSLPDGDARYRFAIHSMTTTDKDPQVIHDLGLSEVKRIEGEMTAIARKLHYKDLKAMRAALKTDPKVHATSRQQIVDLYTKYIAQMQPKLPELFGLLPKTEVKVVPVQEYREKEAAAAEYNQGTPDGSRPGMVYVNTGDYQNRSLLPIEDTAYHEGVPGHHMQISIAQTLPGLPPFRQQAGYNAYVEGWALYAERLGKEIGFYQDPLSDYGRLSGELLRADRLVLDTGVHYKHWTREQMVKFFREHSSEDEPDIQAETDRYIAWPGQALAYKLGQLKILDLRERARKELGAKFDIRAFHDEILDGGALPLDVMDGRVSGWIAAQKAGATASGQP
ncbi:DUF885 domain-containing protein [Nevskia soli]|uniref:DUF885 domain-containing protein n=1 Tax=Nevskia soli TaxID=418856 RepID=UPI0004A716E9|nr:DUF885 domain-containing protein [Nevskia soli]